MHTLKEKIAQLIVPRLDGNRLEETAYLEQVKTLVDIGIGGFILFGGKISGTPAAINRLQERARIPLMIASDIERGLGQQISGGTRFPSQWAVSEAIDRNDPDDVALLYDMMTAVREECIAAGIHVVFSPVADVNVNPDNPIICTRSFGEEPEKVSWFVKEYVKGLQGGMFDPTPSPLKLRGEERGIIACAKHFPGHGDTAVDSHTSLPVINADRGRLEKVELPPFRAAIEAGVGMIMIGHLKVPALEPEPIPATFSRRIVKDLLRKELGFRGIVVTDAMDMGALKAICDEGEAAVRCLEAGCDILLHPSDSLKTLDAVVKAVEQKRLKAEMMEEAFSRVMNVKSQKSVVRSQDDKELLTSHSSLAYTIAKKAIKFRKGRALGSSEKIVCVVIDDDGDGSVANPFLDGMKRRIPGFRTILTPSEIKGDEIAVIPIFSKVSAWKGSSGISEKSSGRIKDVLDKAGRAVLISFGSPYILDSFDADVIIDSFDPADFMQLAVIERLI